MKTAIVYDRVNKWGGAERVLLALHELFPDAPLYTLVYDYHKAPWAKVFPQVIPSFLQKIPILRNYHELLGWLAPIVFETFNFDGFDLVISVTSEAAKGILTKPKTLHICYCLTPTRYLWSGYKEYLNNPPKYLRWIPLYRYISQPFLNYAKIWDKIAAQRPDIIIGISTEVQKRIKKYYGRNSVLIFPPVDIQKFKINSVNKKNIKDNNNKFFSTNYYLMVGRLVPYKKVDLAIEAFIELGLNLIIVGTGSEADLYRFRYKSYKNIIFKGYVTDVELLELYSGAKALIYPQEEDFGITAVEAQAVGIPVIAYKEGGIINTVIDGKTGILFNNQTKEDIVKAVKHFDDKYQHNKMRTECIKNAQRFSIERFHKEFLDLLQRTV